MIYSIGVGISNPIITMFSREYMLEETLLSVTRVIHPQSPYSGGASRDPNKANRTKVRQIAKFGMIVYYKIVINNLIKYTSKKP